MLVDFKIKKLIQQHGSITIDKMMDEVLSQNPSSYYQKQEKLGSQGDFTTSPEISQLFGEIIGIWSINCWKKMGSPKNISLVELGPGRGLLMRDLLKVAKLVPEFYKSLKIELIEINQHFIKYQKQNLANIDLTINYHSQIEFIDKCPAIIIANEFFDAMPIKQYIKIKELWYESVLITDPNDDKIKFDKIDISEKLQNYLLKTYSSAHNGAIIEKSYKSIEIIKFISNHIKKFSGSILIIDYGYDINPIERTHYQYNSTLQAIKNHKYYPLLKTLGEADLSAHVDFHTLKIIAKNIGLNVYGTISQHDFLTQNGILLRSNILQKILPISQANIIEKQVNMLILPKKMGLLFKVLNLSS